MVSTRKRTGMQNQLSGSSICVCYFDSGNPFTIRFFNCIIGLCNLFIYYSYYFFENIKWFINIFGIVKFFILWDGNKLPSNQQSEDNSSKYRSIFYILGRSITCWHYLGRAITCWKVLKVSFNFRILFQWIEWAEQLSIYLLCFQ